MEIFSVTLCLVAGEFHFVSHLWVSTFNCYHLGQLHHPPPLLHYHQLWGLLACLRDPLHSHEVQWMAFTYSAFLSMVMFTWKVISLTNAVRTNGIFYSESNTKQKRLLWKYLPLNEKVFIVNHFTQKSVMPGTLNGWTAVFETCNQWLSFLLSLSFSFLLHFYSQVCLHAVDQYWGSAVFSLVSDHYMYRWSELHLWL